METEKSQEPGAKSQVADAAAKSLVDRLANLLMDKREEGISRAVEALLGLIVAEVVMPEYRYWANCPDDFGATGALANVIARLKGFDVPAHGEAPWRGALRAAIAQAEANVELHIGREVYHKETARAVVADFKEQLLAVLGAKIGDRRSAIGDGPVALMTGYRELSRGRRILELGAAMRQAGLDELGRPRLAICRASAGYCWFESLGSEVSWRDKQERWSLRSNSRRMVRLPRGVFTGNVTGKTLRAIVPCVPPRFRPRGNLSGYRILWEAEWETVPVDPMLLKPLGGTLYAVLAHWDLTPLEQAVLQRRLP